MVMPAYEFTNNWFNNHTRPVWEEVLLPMADQFDTYLEIGICEGQSMIWALDNLQPSVAVGIDPWVNDAHRINAEINLDLWREYTKTKPVLRLFHEKSQDALREDDEDDDLRDESFDLIYVDGSHFAHEALTDYVLCWSKLKVGGIMVMDDYNRRWHMGRPHSHEAIDAFLHGFEKRYDEHFVIRNPRQVAVRRIK